MTTDVFSLQILAALGLFLSAILVHELSHLIFLRRFGSKNANITFNGREIIVGEEKDYKHLSKRELLIVYLSGILSGFIVINAGFVLLPLPLSLMLFILYIIGSYSDMKNIKKNVW